MVVSSFEYHGSIFQLQHDDLAGESLNPDAVLGVGGATRTLLNLIPVRHFEKVWDLGCGSGAISIAVSTHCEKVIATDISERALDFAKQSAHINEIENIEFRLGSLTNPIENETFDLIVSNPPFVIGDVTNLEHRESPFEADGLTRELLRAIPKHLDENGIAIFLTAWLETESEDWQDRIEQMLPDDVHVLVGLRDLQAIDEYVATWLADAKIDDENMMSNWKAKLNEWKVRHVAFGFVVLQKDVSVEPCHNLNDVRNATRLPNGEEVITAITQMKQASALSALSVITSSFTAATSQSWRGDVALDGVLSGLRTNLSAGLDFEGAVEKVAAELKLDPEDVRVYGLVGVKTLVSMGLLALNTPRI
ncbi:MAG: hypothetical protein RLZZ508_1026 [Actinomycetota bacterium]|jgi:SAM-dependent methyltransferase